MEREYPCDYTNECPYGEGGGTYFCRVHCGLGVDVATSEPEKEED